MYRAFVSLKVVYRWVVAIDGVLKFINSRWKTSVKREFSRLINIAETMQCCPRAVCHRLWSVDMGCKHNASIPGGTLVLPLCVVRAIISLIKQTICPAVIDEIIRHERFRWRTVRKRLLLPPASGLYGFYCTEFYQFGLFVYVTCDAKFTFGNRKMQQRCMKMHWLPMLGGLRHAQTSNFVCSFVHSIHSFNRSGARFTKYLTIYRKIILSFS